MSSFEPVSAREERLVLGAPRPVVALGVVSCLFSLSYFSSAFLLLALSRVGFELKQVALLYGLLNLAFTVAAVPVGWLGDRMGRRAVIAISYLLFAVVAAGFALVNSKAGALALLLVYGVFYAIDEGQTKAYLADLVPEAARATAIGTYGFVTALANLPASFMFGFIWRARGPAAAFMAASAVALLALSYFLALRTKKSSRDVAFAPGAQGRGYCTTLQAVRLRRNGFRPRITPGLGKNRRCRA